jgi:hypothetical protein
MLRAMNFSPLIQRSLKASMHNLRRWPLHVQLNPLRIQVATLIHVTAIQRSNPNQLFDIRVVHQHPSAHQAGKKTYGIDVLLAENDDAADVCWRFQIVEGEDPLDRLLAYAQAFGKHGLGDEDYDEYVHAFQVKITGLAVRRMLYDNMVLPSFAEKTREGDKDKKK